MDHCDSQVYKHIVCGLKTTLNECGLLDLLIFGSRSGLKLTVIYKVNNKARTDVYSPVRIVLTGDLNQVPELWLPVNLGLEKKKTNLIPQLNN